MKKEIDYYGTKDSYIHLKFGDIRKMYNFTKELEKKYPDFTREYAKYWNCEKSKFTSPFQVVSYIYDKNIPINLYYNFTDTLVKDREEVIDYLVRENSYVYSLNEK